MPNRPFRKYQFGQSLESLKKFIEIPFPLITFYFVPSNQNLSTIWALYTTLSYFDFVARSEWPTVGRDCRVAGGVCGLGWARGDLVNVARFIWNPILIPRLSEVLLEKKSSKFSLTFTQEILDFWREDILEIWKGKTNKHIQCAHMVPVPTLQYLCISFLSAATWCAFSSRGTVLRIHGNPKVLAKVHQRICDIS